MTYPARNDPRLSCAQPPREPGSLEAIGKVGGGSKQQPELRADVKRRLEAIAALLLTGASIVLAAVVAVQAFPRGLSVLACAVLAVASACWALLHRGFARILGASASAALVAGAVLLVVVEGRPLEDALVLAGISLSLAAARAVYATHAKLPWSGLTTTVARPPSESRNGRHRRSRADLTERWRPGSMVRL